MVLCHLGFISKFRPLIALRHDARSCYPLVTIFFLNLYIVVDNNFEFFKWPKERKNLKMFEFQYSWNSISGWIDCVLSDPDLYAQIGRLRPPQMQISSSYFSHLPPSLPLTISSLSFISIILRRKSRGVGFGGWKCPSKKVKTVQSCVSRVYPFSPSLISLSL